MGSLRKWSEEVMETLRPTKSMIYAVRRVRPSERKEAASLAEATFFTFMGSANMEDAPNQKVAREWAGEAAAAEVLYRFA